jgi:hypothetical protein
MGDDQARVIATLLRGPSFTKAAATSDSTFQLGTSEHALLELPRVVPQELVAEFSVPGSPPEGGDWHRAAR